MNSNNNENNNEGLNALSLGSVDSGTENLNVPINDIPPVTPLSEEPMETLEEGSNVDSIPEAVSNAPEVSSEVISEVPAQPDINAIPEVAPLEPVAPINYDIPEVIDNAPVFNDIGTVPPITDIPAINAIAEPAIPEEPKKKGMNKTLFVVIIILALCAVGGGVYIILNKTNSKPLVSTKLVKIEAGSVVSTDIKDYAVFNNIDSSTCNFDTSEITDTKAVGTEYKFIITCGDKSYQGKAKIVDTTVPDVTLREVNVAVNEEVTAEDFIADCKDATKCSYSFKDEAKLKEYLNVAASYHVPIIVKDEAGNEKEVTGILNVSENVSSLAVICKKTFDSYDEEIRLGLIEEDYSFNRSTKRIYTFKFSSKEDYEKLRDENKDKQEITYLDMTGAPSFDDDNLILTLTKKVAYTDLVNEVGSEVPSSYGELKQFFENREYTCSFGYF